MEDASYGCLFCLTGKENAVARAICAANAQVRATPVRQEKHKSEKGSKSKVEAILMPGYVFFETPAVMESLSWMPRTDVIRILAHDGEWKLLGEDERFAQWVFRYDGLLTFSKAYQEGNRVRVVSGPLKDMEGQITRVDRRGRGGQVEVRFDHRTLKIWLGFEWIEPAQRIG